VVGFSSGFFPVSMPLAPLLNVVCCCQVFVFPTPHVCVPLRLHLFSSMFNHGLILVLYRQALFFFPFSDNHENKKRLDIVRTRMSASFSVEPHSA
jgi:hypothetical protein